MGCPSEDIYAAAPTHRHSIRGKFLTRRSSISSLQTKNKKRWHILPIFIPSIHPFSITSQGHEGAGAVLSFFRAKAGYALDTFFDLQVFIFIPRLRGAPSHQ